MIALCGEPRIVLIELDRPDWQQQDALLTGYNRTGFLLYSRSDCFSDFYFTRMFDSRIPKKKGKEKKREEKKKMNGWKVSTSVSAFTKLNEELKTSAPI